MNPAQAPQGDFITTLEPILLILGGVMTLAVGIFLVWLLRHVRKEDEATMRESERFAESRRDAGGST